VIQVDLKGGTFKQFLLPCCAASQVVLSRVLVRRMIFGDSASVQ
jgi:hypothetical protein